MAAKIAPVACAVLAAVRVLHAQTYTAAVPYSLNTPSGFSSVFPADTPAASAQGQVIGSATASTDHAMVWIPATGGVDLAMNLPAGTIKSYAAATDGVQQGGYAEGSAGAGTDQALLWSGSGNSMVNLNPTQLTGMSASEVEGLCPGQQVGYGTGPGVGYHNHAMLWTGSAASAVDLNPDFLGVNASMAMATDGDQQVGSGTGSGTQNESHALLWASTAATAIDLNPGSMGITSSAALGVFGGQQVGRGLGISTGYDTHALLWNSSAGSAIDLNPAITLGTKSSEADGTNGVNQVGWGALPGSPNHAMLWAGTASSAIDLQTLLPATGTWSSSYASSIDSAGNVFGVANGTLGGVSGFFAIEWSRQITTGATDIGRGSEILPGASLGSITAQVRSGFNGGSWNGTTGVTSSAAAADTTHLTAVGVIQNNQGGAPVYSASNLFEGAAPSPTDVLVKYTYYGDANLDGAVNSADYTLIDAAYLADQSAPGSLTGWFNGDFNYDGTINGSDYTLIDNAFNEQGAQLTNQRARATAQITDVPESGDLRVLPAFLPFLRRRRR
jgi:hypothetical protein